jgi:hypothetical protein
MTLALALVSPSFSGAIETASVNDQAFTTLSQVARVDDCKNDCRRLVHSILTAREFVCEYKIEGLECDKPGIKFRLNAQPSRMGGGRGSISIEMSLATPDFRTVLDLRNLYFTDWKIGSSQVPESIYPFEEIIETGSSKYIKRILFSSTTRLPAGGLNSVLLTIQIANVSER